MTTELTHILWLIEEARKTAEAGTRHYLIQAAAQIRAAIDFRAEMEAKKKGGADTGGY